MISSELSQIISKLGFTEQYIQKKVEEVLAVATLKNLHIGADTPMLICYDMNGPLTSTKDAALHPIPGVQEAMNQLKGGMMQKALVSGWDIQSLKAFRDRRLGLSDISIVGEHGTVWAKEGITHEVDPIPQEEVMAMKMHIIKEAARENLKLALQGNESSRVTGLFFEADGPTRGNILGHILLEERKVDTKTVFFECNKDLGFRFSEGKILFPLNQSTIREFDRVLRLVFPLRSVRLSLEGGDIAFWVDTQDRPDYTVKDMEDFITKTLLGPWVFLAHDDFGIDIMHKDTHDKKVTKESTSYLLAESMFGRQSYILTNVGDRPSDVFIASRSIFFAQKGTKAEKYCKENSIPYVVVEHGGDYSLIIAAMVEKKQVV